MNRKKLNDELSKLNEAEEVQSEPVLTHKTFCFYKDLGRNLWVVAEVGYNPVSGHIGKMKEIYTDPMRGVVEEKFRVCVGREVFGI